MIAIDLSQLVTAEARAAAALQAAKARAAGTLASTISLARATYITMLPGQDMIYQAKEAEARAWVTADTPDIADYPLLAAEIGITAPDADQLAQIWLNMATLWRAAAAVLEALRLTVGAAIDAAQTPEDVEAALGALANLSEGANG